MKTFLVGISMAILMNGTGFAAGTQTCTLATKTGPFTSFKIEYKTASKANVTLSYSKDSGSVGKPVRVEDVVAQTNKDGEVSLSLSDGDWQSTSIQLGEDDNGVAAFVIFSSDGPSLRSFYRCTASREKAH